MAAPHEKLGIGVAGCGNLAYWTHLPLARRLDGARLVGASDPDREARQRAAKRASVPVVAELDELLAMEGLDAVLVATPPHVHAATAVHCLRAGKHVYIEKPMAIDKDDAERLADEHGRSELVACVGFNRRLHPAFEQAYRAIREDRIGKVRAITMRFCEPEEVSTMAPWRRQRDQGGGVLLDLATHHVDLVRWLLDEEIMAVRAQIGSEASDHDESWIELQTESGVVATGFYSFRAGRSDMMDIVGSRATIRVDRHRTGALIQMNRRLGYGVRYRPLPTTGATWRWRAARLLRPSVESSFQRSLQQFVAECRGALPRVLADVVDGQRNLEVLLAAESSARCREPVELQTSKPST